MRSWITAGVIASSLLVLSGCTHNSPRAAEATGEPRPSASATIRPSAAAAAASMPPSPESQARDGLTGFGATQAAWDAHHVADPRFEQGTAYDANSTLGDGTRFDDQYYGVVAIGGRILNYSERMPEGTNRRVALVSIVENDLPADVRLTWKRVETTCEQIQFTSRTLQRALGSGPDAAGVLVSLYSGASDQQPYEPSRITQVYFTNVLFASPGDASC